MLEMDLSCVSFDRLLAFANFTSVTSCGPGRVSKFRSAAQPDTN